MHKVHIFFTTVSGTRIYRTSKRSRVESYQDININHGSLSAKDTTIVSLGRGNGKYWFTSPVLNFDVKGPNLVTALLTSRHTPSGSENTTSPLLMLPVDLLYSEPSLSVTATFISSFLVPNMFIRILICHYSVDQVTKQLKSSPIPKRQWLLCNTLISSIMYTV